MGLAASIHWISPRISSGNTDESESLRGRETVLGFHAGKVGHANAARLKSTASRTFSKDGEPYTLQGVRTVRRGGHAIPTGSTVPTLLNVKLVGGLKVFGQHADRMVNSVYGMSLNEAFPSTFLLTEGFPTCR